MKYTVILEFSREDEVFLVQAPAFPELHTYGNAVEETAADAREAIGLAAEMYLEEGIHLPVDRAIVVEAAP